MVEAVIQDSFKIGKVSVPYKDSPSDTRNMLEFRDIIRRWCIQNSFIIISPENPTKLTPNIGPDDKLFQRKIFEVNFAKLHTGGNFDSLLMTLRDTEFDFTGTRITNLYVHLMTYLDSEFLNRYINKLSTTLKFISKAPNIWERIFQELPEIWVIYAIQTELHEIVESFIA